MKKILLSLCFLSRLTLAADAVPATPTVAHPITRQIVQRHFAGAYGIGSGTITVSGTIAGKYTSLQARAISTDTLYDSGWVRIKGNYTAGTPYSYSGKLNLLPGQYTIQVKAVNGKTSGLITTVSKVGVGELFIVAGQSLVGNFGQVVNTPTDDRVSATPGDGTWALAVDPQPIAGGSAGSPIPALGSALATSINMPIGFLTVAVGGTSTTQWVNTYYASNLAPAITAFGTNGFRAILWENGQQDGSTGISAATYKSNMASLITSSRTDSGFTVPWGVADHSTELSLTKYATIQGAQDGVITDNASTFAGADSDSMSDSYRFDNTHFSAAGQLVHGGLWSVAIQTYCSAHCTGWQ